MGTHHRVATFMMIVGEFNNSSHRCEASEASEVVKDFLRTRYAFLLVKMSNRNVGSETCDSLFYSQDPFPLLCLPHQRRSGL